MNDESKKGLPSGWWRWPLVPIASVAGSILGSAVAATFQWIGMKVAGGLYEDGWWYLYVMPLINTGVFAFLWCQIAGYVAPWRKAVTTIIMASILATLALMALLIVLVRPEASTGDKIHATLALPALIVGAVMGITKTHEEAGWQ